MSVPTHRIMLHPGQIVDVQLVEILENGYPDDLGGVTVTWQDRDAPVGEIATKGRELQIEWITARRVGPTTLRHA